MRIGLCVFKKVSGVIKFNIFLKKDQHQTENINPILTIIYIYLIILVYFFLNYSNSISVDFREEYRRAIPI